MASVYIFPNLYIYFYKRHTDSASASLLEPMERSLDSRKPNKTMSQKTEVISVLKVLINQSDGLVFGIVIVRQYSMFSLVG